MTGRAVWGTVAAVALVLAGGTFSVAAQTTGQTPVFGSSVDVTRLKVAVVNNDGSPVLGLGAADFQVVEDGVERPVQLVLAPEVAPLDVALVLDFSGSIAEDWPQVRDEVSGFLDALDADDCVYLMPFNSQVGPGQRGHPDAPLLRRLVQLYPLRGRTRLYDAIHEAINEQIRDTGTTCSQRSATAMRRRALVLLTDGIDGGSQFSYADVLTTIWHNDVPVFPLAVGAAAMSSSELRGLSEVYYADEAVAEIRTFQGQLRELARVSGGRFISKRKMADAYIEVLSLLRSYYVVAYPTEGRPRAGWHDIEVRVRGTRHAVLAQPGFYRSSIDGRSAFAALANGREAFEKRSFEDAVRWFDIASAISPDVGMPFFGKGLALEALGRLAEATVAYETSLSHSPGFPTTHARLAVISMGLGALSAAWKHAERARLGGADVREIETRLRRLGSRPAELAALATAPVLFVVSSKAPGLTEQLALRQVHRQLGAQLEQVEDLVLTRWYQHAGYYLVLEPDRVREGPPLEVRVRLELYDANRNRLWDDKIDLGDVADVEGMQRELAAVVRTIRSRFARLRR